MYAYLRLEQRVLPAYPTPAQQWQMGRRAVLYTGTNVVLALGAALAGFAPYGLILPFLVQFAETVWGITHPAVGAKPTHIGIRQTVVSALFTVLFIVMWA